MKKVIFISIGLVIFTFALAIVMSLGNPLAEPSVTNSSGDSGGATATGESPPASVTPAPVFYQDDNTAVSVLMGDGTIQNMTMREYLIGVVAAEMPASFELEALKAQAVASRTDTLYHMYIAPDSDYQGADMSADPNTCQAYDDDAALQAKWGANYGANIAKIQQAVQSTDGQYMEYDSEPILAAFHSSSDGMTEDSEYVWGKELPYLVSVSSPETAADVPNYVSTVTISLSDFTESAQKTYPGMTFGDDTSKWIADITYTPSGRIDSLVLGGVQISGTELRTLYDLRSAAASLDITDGGVVITTTGYGHGVGMSQYGAETYAKEGKSYSEILSLYYTGAALVDDSAGGTI